MHNIIFQITNDDTLEKEMARFTIKNNMSHEFHVGWDLTGK